MARPDWLRAGYTLSDQDEGVWRILDVGPTTVELGHPDRGKHEVRLTDLIDWVEADRWTPETDPRDRGENS